MKKIIALTVLATSLASGNALASQITWGGPAGMSMLTNPNAMSVVNSSILTPQVNELQAAASSKASAAAAASASSSSSTANLIQQEVESSIAANISQSITGQNGAANTGTFDLGNGQSIAYNRGASTTSVTIIGQNGTPINLSFPNIQ